MRQAHLHLKGLETSKCLRILAKIACVDLMMCKFLALRSDKTMQVESQIFAVRFLCQNSSLHYPLKCTFLELLHLQNPYFYFFANVSKLPEDIKKLKTKAIKFQPYPPIFFFLSCKTFAKELLQKLFMVLFYVSAGQNSILTEPKEH